MDWINQLRRFTGQQPCVLVTLIQISGSAPRESGCRMVVSADQFSGSIGGGNLEYQSIAMARELLNSAEPDSQHKKLVGLGPELNQCCGGAVALVYEVFSNLSAKWLAQLEAALESGDAVILASALDGDQSLKQVIYPDSDPDRVPPAVFAGAQALLHPVDEAAQPGGMQVETDSGAWWLERMISADRPVMLFGAGHVGHAVVRALQPLPFELTWVDSREDSFPNQPLDGVRVVRSADPCSLVAQTAPDTTFIVMTHSHLLDEDICYHILQRNQFAWLGLIGSVTKRRRFVHRLEKRGLPSDRVEKMVCPIGLAGIRGKQPATIALSLAAQLMTQPKE